MNYVQALKRKLLFTYWNFLGLKPSLINFLEILNQKKLSNYSKILGVYDYNSYKSAYSIGDYLCYLFFFKIFTIYKKKIVVLIICDQKNKLNKFGKKILNIQVLMTKIFLSKHLIKVKVINWTQFKKQDLDKFYIPYKKFVFNRQDIRHYFVSMFNILLKNENQKHLKNFLIKDNAFDSFKNNMPKRFITWHIRQNSNWANHRNITEYEFLELYKILKMKIKKIPIVIISDEKGCSFAKKISKKKKLDLIFCKDISKSIFSDFYLIMRSQLFFTFKAGGMLVIPWFSKKNFIWGGTIGLKNQIISGRSFKLNKLHFWQTEKQYWINSSSFMNFKNELNKIDFSKFNL